MSSQHSASTIPVPPSRQALPSALTLTGLKTLSDTSTIQKHNVLTYIQYRYTLFTGGYMITTVSKWGNSLGVRLPAGVAASTGISSGDKVEVTEAADGSIVIRKRGKEKSQLKAFGMLHEYANPDLIPLEKDAFGLAMEEKYSKETADVH